MLEARAHAHRRPLCVLTPMRTTLSVLTLFAALQACAPHGSLQGSKPESSPAPRAGLAVLDGDATINPDARVVSASWRVSFVPTSGDSARILLNGGFHVSSLSGPLIDRYVSTVSDGTLRITVYFKQSSNVKPTFIDIAYSGALEAP